MLSQVKIIPLKHALRKIESKYVFIGKMDRLPSGITQNSKAKSEWYYEKKSHFKEITELKWNLHFVLFFSLLPALCLICVRLFYDSLEKQPTILLFWAKKNVPYGIVSIFSILFFFYFCYILISLLFVWVSVFIIFHLRMRRLFEYIGFFHAEPWIKWKLEA